MTTLISLVDLLFLLYTLVLVARIILSWMAMYWRGVVPYNPIVEWIHRLTDPLLDWIRSKLPPTGMIDWSPTIALLGLWVLRQVVITILRSF